jgi:hypothetical protein
MRSVSSSLRRGVATLAVAALLLFPLAAFADAGEIHLPPGAPTASQLPSAGAEIQPPIGFWDALLLVWLEAGIGPPIG